MSFLVVNGETIDPGRIREETYAVAKLLADQMPDEDPLAQRMRAREWAEENLIEDTLIRQAAWSDPEPVDPDTIARTETSLPSRQVQVGCLTPITPREDANYVEEQFRCRRLIARITGQVTPPRHAEAMAYYRAHRDSFYSPDMVHAAHIVRNIDERTDESAARAAIDRALAELERPRPFNEVADELSDCPGRGGDLGFFPRGQMVQAFDDVVFHLAAGQVSGIFRTGFGFHIATVLERTYEGIRPFESVRDQIEQQLLAEKHQAALHRFVDELRARAEIRRVKDRELA